MKSNLTFFAALFFLLVHNNSLHAQQASVAAGGTASSGGASISYSIGQPVYTAVSGLSGINSQGVQQAEVNVRLSIRVMLSGTYDQGTGMMRDSLRALGLIPLTEPYSTPPYSKPVVLETAGESFPPAFLAGSNENAIVDWIFVELRSATNSSIIVASKRGLLQRDGDIVSHIDGTSPLVFSRMVSGNYYVAVKHRNHLGVMTDSPVALSPGSVSIDFTTMPLVYTINGLINTPRRSEGGLYTLWPGDANFNKIIKYNGIANDKDVVLAALGGIAFINSTLNSTYRPEDLNLDGKIRYNGADNDRVLILNAIGVTTPNVVFNQHTPN